MHSSRPIRLMQPDFAGRMIALPDEPESWRRIRKEGKDILLLGPGPGEPWKLPFIKEALASGRLIYWHEAPQLLSSIPERQIPAEHEDKWRYEADLASLMRIASASQVYFYLPGMRLAPRYWSELLARIDLLDNPCPEVETRLAWLPGNESLLMHRELCHSLKNIGYSTICEECPEANARSLFASWAGKLPEIAISINFRGLDGSGHIFELCRESKIPLAVWLVDNPWNILASIPLPWWKEANLFITDASFTEQLREYGAKRVWHLPLAASYAMLDMNGVTQRRKGNPVFVGNSRFTGKDRFFSGLKIEKGIFIKAMQTIDKGAFPDFHWWQEQYKSCLWPGKDARRVAFGAEEFSMKRRAKWIEKALACGLHIIGDANWRNLLQGASVQAPVDYYRCLPQIYADSECVLNVTSQLLPQSLNQRHFDVWAAGGFLLTDYSSGLDIFPRELVEPVILRSPEDFCQKLSWLRENQDERDRLGMEWKNCIMANHTYEKRISTIREKLASEAGR